MLRGSSRTLGKEIAGAIFLTTGRERPPTTRVLIENGRVGAREFPTPQRKTVMTFNALSVSRSIEEEEYRAQVRALEAAPGPEARVPNVSCGATVAVALRLVARARHRACAPKLSRYASLLGEHTADELERRALLLSEVDARTSTAEREILEARAKRERLVVEARALRSRVLMVLDYHVGTVLRAELDEIRRAKSNTDLCRGMTRLAHHYRQHAHKFGEHDSHCDPTFPSQLHALAEALTEDPGPQRVDLRHRNLAWTRVADTYEVLRVAAMLFFRTKPRILEWFPPLRTAALAFAAKEGR